MRQADTPSGPGTPLEERSDAATEQEGLDELAVGRGGAEDVDPTRAARHADRNAHAESGKGAGGNLARGGS